MTFEELRKSVGLTREELAVKCQVSAGTIQNWEKGRSIPDGSADCFIRYCAAYDCSLGEIREAGRVSGHPQSLGDSGSQGKFLGRCDEN